MAQFKALILSPANLILRRDVFEAEDEFNAMDVALERFTAKFGEDPDATLSITEVE